jgi:hypothetical protein
MTEWQLPKFGIPRGCHPIFFASPVTCYKVRLYGGFRFAMGVPLVIIHFIDWDFHYKPTILG